MSSKPKEFSFPDALGTQVANVLKSVEILVKHLKVQKETPTAQLIALLKTEHCSAAAKQTIRSAIVNAVQLLPKENGLVLCENGLVPELYYLIEDPPSPAHAQAAIQALNLVMQHCEAALLGEDDKCGVVAACAKFASDTGASYKLRVGALRILTDIIARKGADGAKLLERKNAVGCFPEVLVQWAPMPGHYMDGVFSSGLQQCFAALNALLPVAPSVVFGVPDIVSSVLCVVEAHSPVASEAVAFLLTLSTTEEGRKAIMNAKKHAYDVISEWLPLYEEDSVKCNMVRVLTNLCVDDENVAVIGKSARMLECLQDTLANCELDSSLWECSMRCLNNLLSTGEFYDKWVEIGGLTTLVKQLRKSKKPTVVEPLFIVLGNMLLASENARDVFMAENGDKLLVSLLDSTDVSVVEQAARSLCNVASCSRDARKAIFNHDGLYSLLKLSGRYSELPKAAEYAMEGIISLSDCPAGVNKLTANPSKAAEVMKTLLERAKDRNATPSLRAHALGALANVSRIGVMRVIFIQSITPDPLMDVICDVCAVAKAKPDDREISNLVVSALSAMTNIAADGRTRLWYKKLDDAKKATIAAIDEGIPETSEIKAPAQRMKETLEFHCEDSYEVMDFAKPKQKKKKPTKEEVPLDQMDLESLQARLEELQKVANNAQVAFDCAKQDTAQAKKKCQHEKKKLLVAQEDHAKQLKQQQAEKEKVDKEQEVALEKEKESIRNKHVTEFQTVVWPEMQKDLKKNKKMKADQIAAEENKMKRDLMKRVEKEQEKCVLKNEIRKEKSATDIHVHKMRFMLEERNLAHAYHCSKFKFSRAQEVEKDASNALEEENAKIKEIETLIESVIAAQKAEEERLRKQKEEEEAAAKAGTVDPELEARKAKEAEEAKKKQHQRRTFIVDEICETEENYVNGLSHALTVYRAPLLEAARLGKKGAILTREQINSIFSNMETIRDYNAVFLDLLKTRLSKWNEETVIGDTFLAVSKLLLSYTEYVNNYSRAIDVLGKLRQQIPAFAAFMDEADRENVNLKLVSILIFPIQRIPRYILLIQDLLKHTNPDHPDYHNLEHALEVMNKTGSFINESKREAENASKLAEINQSMKGKHPSFKKTGRYFIHETAVTLTMNGEKNPLPGMVYIWTDLILITHAVGRGQSQYDAAIDLAKSTSVKSKQSTTALDLAGPITTFDDEKDQKKFAKIDKKTGQPEQQHYAVLMKTVLEANRLLSKIESTRRALTKK